MHYNFVKIHSTLRGAGFREMVKLKDFVRQTLVEVVSGIQEAQKDTVNTGAIISPHPIVRGNRTSARGGRDVEDVHFDVAVTMTKEKGAGAKAGIPIIKVEGSARGTHSDVSRITFSVAVCWPVVEVESKSPN